MFLWIDLFKAQTCFSVSPSSAQDPQWGPCGSGRETKLLTVASEAVGSGPCMSPASVPSTFLHPLCSGHTGLLEAALVRALHIPRMVFLHLAHLCSWPDFSVVVKSLHSRFSRDRERLNGAPVPAALLPINVIPPLTCLPYQPVSSIRGDRGHVCFYHVVSPWARTRLSSFHFHFPLGPGILYSWHIMCSISFYKIVVKYT